MPSNSALSILRAHYAQAAELLLLRRLDEAEVACERALGQLGPMIREVKKTTRSEDSRRNVDWPRKVWLLRIALTSAQLEEQPISTVNDEQLLLINERVRNSYADNEDIHPDIIAALEMLALKFNCLDAARIIAETWLASLTDVIFEAVTRANTLITDPSQSGTLTDRELSGSTVLLSHPSTTNDADSSNTTANVEEQLRKGYERVIELYTLHVLPQLDEWETAHEFLTYNDMLHTTNRKYVSNH
ncbi:hypothetical protein BDF19DRAFT_267924 [Syncephalis fuscata]|nr:hypothetical protein BDF19DRAFT_267924 [Syncephalis fuscata]